jgi:hypothetical protein
MQREMSDLRILSNFDEGDAKNYFNRIKIYNPNEITSNNEIFQRKKSIH